jgi:hypothetical protein
MLVLSITLSGGLFAQYAVNYDSLQQALPQERDGLKRLEMAWWLSRSPDLELAEVIEATTRNVSFGGMSLRLAAKPPVERVYVHLHSSPQALGYALLGRVVRCQEADGGFEVGVRFAER